MDVIEFERRSSILLGASNGEENTSDSMKMIVH